MNSRSKVFVAIGVILIVGAAVTIVFKLTPKQAPWTPVPLMLEGSVLTQNMDPGERTPIPGVAVTAMGGSTVATGKSDPTGYFSVTLNPGVRAGQPVVLKFQKPDFKDSQITTVRPGNQVYVVQMEPLQPKREMRANLPAAPAKIMAIKNVRVRYTFKEASTVAVGSIAKQFAALNIGNVPCRNQHPCSPDGKWKATRTTLPLDAEAGNEFRNLRVSCMAGPCHFAQIESTAPTEPVRETKVSVLNWSDTTDFLVEADVIRTMRTDMVRQSYPFILADTMNFAMPASAKGPSIEADLDNTLIVFPLGPELILSWATCSKQVSEDGNQLYRCRLKPGYRFE